MRSIEWVLFPIHDVSDQFVDNKNSEKQLSNSVWGWGTSCFHMTPVLLFSLLLLLELCWPWPTSIYILASLSACKAGSQDSSRIEPGCVVLAVIFQAASVLIIVLSQVPWSLTTETSSRGASATRLARARAASSSERIQTFTTSAVCTTETGCRERAKSSMGTGTSCMAGESFKSTGWSVRLD